MTTPPVPPAQVPPAPVQTDPTQQQGAVPPVQQPHVPQAQPQVTPPTPSWNPPPPLPPVPTPPPASQPPVDDGSRDISRLPQWAQKEIQDLRKENADRRVAARSAVVAQHAFAAAEVLGVNGHALLGSTAFSTAAAELDPSSQDFNEQLAAKVKEILVANPWMALTTTTTAPTPPPAPPAGGADFQGSGGGHTSQSIDEQIAEAEKNRDFARAIALKRQKSALHVPH